MTLFKVDKNSASRNAPTVNATDVHMNPKAHSTTSISPRAEGTQTVGKVTTKDSKIVANDGSNNIGLFGFDDAGNMVVKVAKPGYDANSATDDQLVFNSSQNVFKIVDSGTSDSFNVTSSTPFSITINHNLGYQPIVIAYVIGTTFGSATNTDVLPYYVLGSTSGVPGAFVITGAITYSVGNNSIAFTVYNPGSISPGLTGNIKYYILQESAN